jgi:hypothetical protein
MEIVSPWKLFDKLIEKCRASFDIMYRREQKILVVNVISKFG